MDWRIVKSVARGVLRRRKGLALLTFMVAAVILVPASYQLSKEPPRFQTGATILVESRPERVPIFQEFSPFRPLPVQLAILYSRSLAEGVLETLTNTAVQELLENPFYVDYVAEIRKAYLRLTGGVQPPVSDPQRRALSELQYGRVRFDADENGIVQITATASRPRVAVEIANAYIEALLARTRSFNIEDARVSREFLEQQVAEVKKKLDASEQALRSFTTGHGGLAVPEKSQATAARLSQTETALAEVAANRKMVEARLQNLRAKLETQKDAPPPVPPPPSTARAVAPAVERLREQLSKLETALLDLRASYTDEHPRVLIVKNQIADLQRELAAAVKETTALVPAPSSVPPSERVSFTEQVLVLETSLQALTAQEEALQKQAEGLRQGLAGLSRAEMDYAGLTREVDSNQNLYALLSDRLTGVRIRERGEMKVVKVIDPPAPPVSITGVRRLKVGGLALLVAVVLGAGVPAAVEWFRRVIETEEDVEATTGLPVLAVVPRLRSSRPILLPATDPERLENGKREREHFLFSEAFRTLRVEVQLARRTEGLRTLLVTSARPGEGKSTVLVNLGLAFHEAGRRVVIADTDLQQPTLHKTLDIQQNAGLVDMLHARRGVEQSLERLSDGLWVVPRGSALQPDTRGMLATSRLKELLDEMASRADLVVCDSSPVLLIPDNLFLAAVVDGVILVAKVGATASRDLARANSALHGVGAKVLGVVINEVPASRLKRYYDYMARATKAAS